MITVLTRRVNDSAAELSQASYDRMVAAIDYSRIHCACGCCEYHIHAYYERKLKHPGCERMIITRIRCSSCGITHAILPDTLVPYSQNTLEDHISIVKACTAREQREVLNQNPLIRIEDLRRIRQRYERYWKERLAGAGIKLDEWLTDLCLKFYQRQFMQIRCTPCIALACNHTE